MNNEGYTDITSIDYSSVCIERLKHLTPKCKQAGLKFAVADIRDLGSDFPNDSFAVIIDKGTLDSILCGHAFEGVHDALAEVMRVLRPGGRFICITYGSPHTRICHLQNPDYNWAIEVYTIDKLRADDINVPEGNGEFTCRTAGPFVHPAELSSLDCLDCHFVYSCQKPQAVALHC